MSQNKGHADRQASLARIARPSGALGMVAIDQRESLRMMLQVHAPDPVDDAAVEAFKVSVARSLAPHASAMLFDARFGFPALAVARRVAPLTGIIVAADRLIQLPGQPVTDTEIDDEVDPRAARQAGAAALKLLLLWKGPATQERLLALAVAFMATCHANGLIGIVEAMVREPVDAGARGWNPEQAMVDAATCLAASQPDLYKGEVPFYGKASSREIQSWAERVTGALSCPWVVLSQGVAIDDFAPAVEAACRGGASGFLAGRAIWADAIGPSAAELLVNVSVPRLQRLGEIVDREARPWPKAQRAAA
jgi:sulfofructosephosphate aldolase